MKVTIDISMKDIMTLNDIASEIYTEDNIDHITVFDKLLDQLK
jgi:hypothetical protein